MDNLELVVLAVGGCVTPSVKTGGGPNLGNCYENF